MSTQPMDADLAEVVWWGTQTVRVRAHAARGVSRCPTRLVPYSASDPTGRHLNARCREDGCLGIVHSIYLTTVTRLQDRATGQDHVAVSQWVPYARRVVASQVAELDRAGRVARGLPAKPTRTDGVPGRVIEAMRHTTADPVRREWLEQLFRMVRAYVCRDNRQSVEWPTDMWAAEKCAVDGCFRSLGTPAARREIEQDVDEVLRVARDVAGEEWLGGTILNPFRAVVGPLPDDLDVGCPIDDADPAELALVSQFRTRYAASRTSGCGPDEAFLATSLAICGRQPRGAAADVIADLEAWLADRQAPERGPRRLGR